MTYVRKRIKNIFGNIKAKAPDLIFLKNATNPLLDMSFFYTTDIQEGLFESAISILQPDGKQKVYCSPLEEESAWPGEKKHFYKLHTTTTKAYEKELPKILASAKLIGINANEMTHANFMRLKKVAKKAKFIDVSEAIMKARAIKDEEELMRLQKACKIVSRTSEDIVNKFKIGMTEQRLASELIYLMFKNGATEISFKLVQFGKHTSEPHFAGGSGKLRKGDFIILDFGCVYKRYHSDLTRTYIAGSPSAKHREIYETVREAADVAMDLAKEGANGKDLHIAAENIINSTKYKGRLIHSLGHSLGLAVHDGLRLYKTVDLPLKSGMVVTIEPGIYVPGFGGVRIEDDIVITKTGKKILTDSTRDLTSV